MPDKTIALRIPEELRTELNDRATGEGETVSAYVRKVIEHHMLSRQNGAGPTASLVINRRLLAQAKCRAELNRLNWQAVPEEVLVERYLEALVEHDRVVLRNELQARRSL